MQKSEDISSESGSIMQEYWQHRSISLNKSATAAANYCRRKKEFYKPNKKSRFKSSFLYNVFSSSTQP